MPLQPASTSTRALVRLLAAEPLLSFAPCRIDSPTRRRHCRLQTSDTNTGSAAPHRVRMCFRCESPQACALSEQCRNPVDAQGKADPGPTLASLSFQLHTKSATSDRAAIRKMQLSLQCASARSSSASDRRRQAPGGAAPSPGSRGVMTRPPPGAASMLASTPKKRSRWSGVSTAPTGPSARSRPCPSNSRRSQ